jgi:hypothetical protein
LTCSTKQNEREKEREMERDREREREREREASEGVCADGTVHPLVIYMSIGFCIF